MSTNFRDWWNQFIQQDRKGFTRLVLVGLVGIILLVYTSFGPAVPSPPHKSNNNTSSREPLIQQEHLISQKVGSILQKIPNAGTVSVSVTLTKSMSNQYVQQNQGNSGTGPVIVSTNSGQKVVPLDEMAPAVGGVVVVAPNARNPQIRAELAQAVETLLQLQAYQVLILPN